MMNMCSVISLGKHTRRSPVERTSQENLSHRCKKSRIHQTFYLSWNKTRTTFSSDFNRRSDERGGINLCEKEHVPGIQRAHVF